MGEKKVVWFKIKDDNRTYIIRIENTKIVMDLKDEVKEKLFHIFSQINASALDIFESKDLYNPLSEGKIIRDLEQTEQHPLLVVPPQLNQNNNNNNNNNNNSSNNNNNSEKELKNILITYLPSEFPTCFDENGDQNFTYVSNYFSKNIPILFRMNLNYQSQFILPKNTHVPQDHVIVDHQGLSSVLYLLFTLNPYPPGSSENTWQYLYDTLLLLLKAIIDIFIPNQNDLFKILRNQNDDETTQGTKRADLVLRFGTLVILRGEEKREGVDMNIPRGELTDKMVWNTGCYGDLPYTFGYATSGPTIQFYAITSSLETHPISDRMNFFNDRDRVILFFLRLGLLLPILKDYDVFNTTCCIGKGQPRESTGVFINYRSTFVYKVYPQNLYNDARTIYTELQKLQGGGHPPKFPQLILPLSFHSTHSLSIKLFPQGFPVNKFQSEKQLLSAINCLIIALNAWHSIEYCHGDVRLSNLIAVDDELFVLIDFDQSAKNGVKTINWNHPSKGQTLTYAHDWQQVAKIIENRTFNLTKSIESLQNQLTACSSASFTLSTVSQQEQQQQPQQQLLRVCQHTGNQSCCVKFCLNCCVLYHIDLNKKIECAPHKEKGNKFIQQARVQRRKNFHAFDLGDGSKKLTPIHFGTLKAPQNFPQSVRDFNTLQEGDADLDMLFLHYNIPKGPKNSLKRFICLRKCESEN